MEVHSCYRCRREVPLVDAAEFAFFEELFSRHTAAGLTDLDIRPVRSPNRQRGSVSWGGTD